MGTVSSRVFRAACAVVLSSGPAWAQLPISGGIIEPAHAPQERLEAARDRAGAGSLLEAREQYLRLLSESRAKTAAAESAAARAAAVEAAARAELAALEARLAYVSLLVQGPATAETRVTCDGQVLPAGSLGVPLPLLPGRHEFRAFSPDLESSTVALTLEPGAVEMVSLTLPTPGEEVEETWPGLNVSPVDAPAITSAPAGAPASPSPVAVPLRSDRPWTERPYLVAAWGSVGVAALSLGAGTFWALRGARSDRADALYDDCSPQCSAAQVDQIRLLDDKAEASARTKVIAGFTLGGLSAIAAGTFFFLDQKRTTSERAARVTPVLGVGYAGLNGRF